MALTDKQVLGSWQVTNDKLMARTFDSGTTFVLAQQLEGPSASADVFILRQDTMLDRSDVTLTAGLDKAAAQDELLDLTYPVGAPAPSGGLGLNIAPTNFETPLGYATFLTSDNSLAYKKAVATPSSQNVAASADAGAGAPAEGWFKRNLKWVIGGAVVLVAGFFTWKATKKKKK